LGNVRTIARRVIFFIVWSELLCIGEYPFSKRLNCCRRNPRAGAEVDYECGSPGFQRLLHHFSSLVHHKAVRSASAMQRAMIEAATEH
jgi:hypothetical protein